MTRVRQDRTRKSGHAHQKNTQDFAPLRLSPTERAVHKFRNVVALLADSGPQYNLLPPSARMAVDACKRAAAQLEKAVLP